MAIGVIAHVTVAVGREAEFEAAFADQARGVRENEPGNRLYQLVRSREASNRYVVMEIYDSDADLEAHRAAPHILANRPRIAPLIGAPTVVEVYDAV